jgi:hypothetical protein
MNLLLVLGQAWWMLMAHRAAEGSGMNVLLALANAWITFSTQVRGVLRGRAR